MPAATSVPVSEATTATEPVKSGSMQRFLGPLALLAPKKIPKPEGGYRKDWSLTILGFALFMFLLATVRLRLMRLSDIG